MHGTCKTCKAVVESLDANLNCAPCGEYPLPQALTRSYGADVSATKVNTDPGRKDDSGKRDWTLLPLDAMEQVVLVLEHGERKYGRDNWKKLEHLESRYQKALWRHMVALTKGESLDPETKLPHLAHLVCSALFIMQHDIDMMAQLDEDIAAHQAEAAR